MKIAAFVFGIWSTLIVVLFIRTVAEGDVIGIHIGVVVLIITAIVAVSVLKEETE